MTVSELAGSHAVVTGGAGFLGSHLCERLLDGGARVTCIDNLLTGRLGNVEHLFGREGFVYVKHDVTNFVHVPGRVDFVLHFASPASPIDYLKLPIQTLKVGALGTHKALGLARAKRARFMLASTSEVYGDPQVSPQPETYWGHVNPVGPRGVYDEAKRFAEAITYAYHRTHDLEVRVARIFNTFGPRMRLDDGRAVPTFIGQALRGEPLTVHGDGSQTRSLCYVDDMVRGLVALLCSDHAGPCNLGNPDQVTVLTLARLVRDQVGSDAEPTFVPRPTDDPQARCPDIAVAQARLGWKPEVALATGLDHTVRWFQERGAQLTAEA